MGAPLADISPRAYPDSAGIDAAGWVSEWATLLSNAIGLATVDINRRPLICTPFRYDSFSHVGRHLTTQNIAPSAFKISTGLVMSISIRAREEEATAWSRV